MNIPLDGVVRACVTKARLRVGVLSLVKGLR
jgi:hypothetical protein